MILVFGGTTEGRKAVQVLDQAGKPFYYSTKGNLQEVTSLNGIRLTGAMDAESMKTFCIGNGIKLVVDAAHPFAIQLHQTIDKVCKALEIPVIRYERIYPDREDDIIWCDDYEDAITKLEEKGVSKLLALTGVQTIGRLKPFWVHTKTWFRIMNREESLTLVYEKGFPETQLLYFDAETNESEIIETFSPEAMLLKESGVSGNFIEKVKTAQRYNLLVFAIKRPILPDDFMIVDGEHGLRRCIEQVLPDYYHLRTGVTTGTCATAAAVAALNAIITRKKVSSVPVTLPNGETIIVPVKNIITQNVKATGVIIKDAGDDADITNGIVVCAKVSILEQKASGESLEKDILIQAGVGIGTVTLPGLGLPVGAAAINPAPQKMIRENIYRLYRRLKIDFDKVIEVNVFVPKGKKIARRTFNPRLGVMGGISIIGNSGIVKPYSAEAFISSIRKGLEVAKATAPSHLVINSGAKSERFLRGHYPDLLDTAFVQYGNHVGDTLQMASELGFKKVTIGLMIGKAVKLAEGNLHTHSGKAAVNKSFLKKVAHEISCSPKTVQAINHITLARELWTVIPPKKLKKFLRKITEYCHSHCDPLLPDANLTIHLISEEGEFI